MTRHSQRRHVSCYLIVSLVFLAAFTAVSPVAAVEALTLRVQDAIATPGGVVAIVLRTYASRPIGQGQLCLVATPIQSPTSPPDNPNPLASYLGSVVFSDHGDAHVGLVAEVSTDPQMIVVQFSSQSGTVNMSDGPLAAFFFRLDESVPPGSTFRLVVDTPNSLLLDPKGNTILIESREGELTSRLPADPFLLQADGTRVGPGEWAGVAVSTLESFPISEGQLVLRYDAAIARGTPRVRMNPRHGPVEFQVDASIPGMVVVNFSSTVEEVNYVPGDLIQIDLPISRQVEIGASSRLWIDSAMSWVAASPGQLLPVKLEDDVVEFVPRTEVQGRVKVSLFEIEQSGISGQAERSSRARGQWRDRGTTRERY